MATKVISSAAPMSHRFRQLLRNTDAGSAIMDHLVGRNSKDGEFVNIGSRRFRVVTGARTKKR